MREIPSPEPGDLVELFDETECTVLTLTDANFNANTREWEITVKRPDGSPLYCVLTKWENDRWQEQ